MAKKQKESKGANVPTLQGYSMKQKKMVDIVDPIISKTAKGGYMCKGQDDLGNKICAILSKVNAEAAIAAGIELSE